MLTKGTKITITILLFCLLGILFWGSWQGFRSDQELNQAKNTIESLKLQLGVKGIELKDTRDKLNAANKDIEFLTINYRADKLYIQELEGRYLKIYAYAQVAEAILIANEIDFRMIEGGLDLKELTGSTNE